MAADRARIGDKDHGTDSQFRVPVVGGAARQPGSAVRGRAGIRLARPALEAVPMIRWVIVKAALAALMAAGAPAAVPPAWEPGAGTATAAQRQAVWAIEQICRLAHEQGAGCIAAPAADLYRGEAGYLASDIARAARYADVFEIQSQGAELHRAAWRHWIAAARRQIERAHPGITIMAGSTTSKPLRPAPPRARRPAPPAGARRGGGCPRPRRRPPPPPPPPPPAPP